MARSLSQANRLGVLVSDALSLTRLRRGYAAASDVLVSAGFGGSGTRSSMTGKLEGGRTEEASRASSAWGPDPVTGYYRPINYNCEVDPVELRQILWNHKVRSSPQ
ncbi:hypothetical protein L6164_012528 [Bauhinia variegata]|uniref:Uncharacterized protein n=1 Tax=Bauhinia variegata TaxID=167791 RepID=A0ACB9P9H9_BAUVA|nr:hypothetical protein L6164_012528 [Bauhinia variegata]